MFFFLGAEEVNKDVFVYLKKHYEHSSYLLVLQIYIYSLYHPEEHL